MLRDISEVEFFNLDFSRNCFFLLLFYHLKSVTQSLSLSFTSPSKKKDEEEEKCLNEPQHINVNIPLFIYQLQII